MKEMFVAVLEAGKPQIMGAIQSDLDRLFSGVEPAIDCLLPVFLHRIDKQEVSKAHFLRVFMSIMKVCPCDLLVFQNVSCQYHWLRTRKSLHEWRRAKAFRPLEESDER